MLWAASFVAGIAVSEAESDWLPAALFVSALLAALSAARVWGRERAARLGFALLLLSPLALAAGAWRFEANDPFSSGNVLERPEIAEQPLTLIGEATEHPRLRWQRIEVRIRAEQLRLADEQRRIEAELLVRLPLSSTVALGDRLEIAGFQLQPGAVVGEAHSARVIERASVGGGRRALADMRSAVNRSLAAALPPPLAGVAQGMVTGSRGSLDRELQADFNTTGLSHLIVISGSNVTLLSALIITSTAWLLGRRSSGLLAIGAALLYCLFVGTDPPVVRATVMAVIFIAAQMLGRPASAPYAIVLAAAGMTAVDPAVLFDLSFQLSFAGTLAIAALAPTLSQRFLSGERGLRGALLDLVMINAIALLATIPLIALHFERVSLVSLPANLLTTPLFAWMFLGSAASGAAGLISEGLGAVLAWPLAWLPLRWFVLVGEGLSDWPGASTSVSGFGHVHALAIYTAMALAAVRPYRELLRPPPGLHSAAAGAAPFALSGILAAAAGGVWLAALSGDDQLRIDILNIGQGDAALIRTPAGQTALIDSGADGDLLTAQLRRALPDGERRLDLLIVTHPQLDHAGGSLSLFGRYELGTIIVSPHHGRAALGRRLQALAEERGIPLQAAQHGDQIVLPGSTAEEDVLLDILWPTGTADEESDLNVHSLVVRLRYGGIAALFAADISAPQEIALAKLRCGAALCDLRADLLKVPHHGSGGSTTDLLLRRTAPRLAVISASEINLHGHPHPDTLALLETHRIPVYQTALHGRITIFSNGDAIALQTEH